MKAAILPAVGAPLVVEEIPTPKPRAGEVLLRVRACGVCHTDLHVMKGEVRFPVPAVLGHEVSGMVEAVGPEVRGVELGAPVVASFIMPCGHCRFCVEGRDDLCEPFFALNRLKGVLYGGGESSDVRRREPAGDVITHRVRRGIRLQGSYRARVRTDVPETIRLAASGRIGVTQPITRRYRLDQADEAYRALDRGEISGRGIVVMG